MCKSTHENTYETRLFYFPDPSGELDQVMRDSKVDAVIISTPTFTHEELVDKSLEAGKAVFCEKPLAETVEATRRLYAKAEKVRIVFGSISQPTDLSKFYQCKKVKIINDLRLKLCLIMHETGKEASAGGLQPEI